MKKINAKTEIVSQIKNRELVKQKQIQIAMGASKLFIKKGYGRTNIREISKASGLTIGNLYDYITKKEDVLYLVFEVFHKLWVNRLEEEGVYKIEDPVMQLRVALQKMFELVDVYRDMVLLMYTETKLLPKEYIKTILMKEGELVQCFDKILVHGVNKGVFKSKDTFFLANIIVYLLSIEALRGWSLRRRYDASKISALITEFIVDIVTKL